MPSTHSAPDLQTKQGVRLLAAAEAGEQGVLKERASPENTGGATAVKITEEEVERNYTPKEREFVDSFLVEFEAADEPQADEDDLAVYSNDYKMYAGGGAESLNIEWDAAMGKADHWDLPPFEDFDPKVGRSWVSCANEACGLFVCCGLPINNHPGLVSIQYLLLSQPLCTHPVTYHGQFPWSQAI